MLTQSSNIDILLAVVPKQSWTADTGIDSLTLLLFYYYVGWHKPSISLA